MRCIELPLSRIRRERADPKREGKDPLHGAQRREGAEAVADGESGALRPRGGQTRVHHHRPTLLGAPTTKQKRRGRVDRSRGEGLWRRRPRNTRTRVAAVLPSLLGFLFFVFCVLFLFVSWISRAEKEGVTRYTASSVVTRPALSLPEYSFVPSTNSGVRRTKLNNN